MNPQKLEFFLVQTLKGFVKVFSAKSYGKVQTKYYARRLRFQDNFSIRKGKVKSKQSDRQRGQGSKKLLVWFSHG
ncbi:hypothetical protein M0802_015113 [Mischocyttarus mexicanus]|nr:hypothetical protein M0802_015113 [Mischocyttarus mexicanus]